MIDIKLVEKVAQLMNRIIMVGPDPKGMGGISRVVKIIEETNAFQEYQIKYISTVSDFCISKILFLIKSLFKFTVLCSNNCKGIYIHTASRRSFYRKCLYIVISALYSRKIILHIHPSYFLEFITKLNKIKKIISYFLLNKTDAFVVLTNDIKNRLEKLFPNKPIHVLRNPVLVDQLQNKDGIVRDDNQLIYLGFYVKEKGVYDLVDAVKIILEINDNIKLNLFGTKGVDALKKYVINKGLESNISVNDWIDDHKKLCALYESAMLILPSYSEGIPNVILEAMATRTPIVATSVGGLKEILKNEENAVIAKVGDPDDLSKKIIMLLADKNLSKTIADNAYQMAVAEFDGLLIKEKLGKILNSTFKL